MTQPAGPVHGGETPRECLSPENGSADHKPFEITFQKTSQLPNASAMPLGGRQVLVLALSLLPRSPAPPPRLLELRRSESRPRNEAYCYTTSMQGMEERER